MSRARDRADGDFAGKELIFDADGDTSITADTDDQIDFKTGGTDRMKLSSAGVLSIPADGGDLTGATNAIHLGASADMKIFHNGGNNYILTDQASQSFTVLSDIVRFNTRNNGESLFGATLDGGFFAKYDNTTTLQTINGGVQVDGDIVLGGSGNGINLGVTSNTDSNTLDDYEEGTWTPGLTALGTAGSTINFADYTKIGRVVHIACAITFVSNSDTSPIQLTNLPFDGNNGKIQALPAPYTSYTANPLIPIIQGTTIYIGRNSYTHDLTYADVSGKFVRMSGTYQVL